MGGGGMGSGVTGGSNLNNVVGGRMGGVAGAMGGGVCGAGNNMCAPLRRTRPAPFCALCLRRFRAHTSRPALPLPHGPPRPRDQEQHGRDGNAAAARADADDADADGRWWADGQRNGRRNGRQRQRNGWRRADGRHGRADGRRRGSAPAARLRAGCRRRGRPALPAGPLRVGRGARGRGAEGKENRVEPGCRATVHAVCSIGAQHASGRGGSHGSGTWPPGPPMRVTSSQLAGVDCGSSRSGCLELKGHRVNVVALAASSQLYECA